MLITQIFFSICSIFSALMIIFNENPIVSLLYLIATFINISILLILLGFEFFGFIFIAIYAGAIAVLFLFIIMMINIPYVYSKKYFFYEISIIIFLICSIFFLSLYFSQIIINPINNLYSITLILFTYNYTESLEIISALLYTHYGIFVLLAGFILFIAMIGSIMIFSEYKFIFDKRYYEQNWIQELLKIK